MIVISSELPELVGLADRVLVMRGGRITAELTGDDISEHSVVYAATSGEGQSARPAEEGGGDPDDQHDHHHRPG